ncbi:poly-gamma-glutamate biosynthesis protein PgsC/CapC [Nocardioides montaniterrae]
MSNNPYLYSPDVVRVVLVMGVVISVLFYERMQLTTGGAIVPAYLALALQAPISVVSTVLAGLLTWAIVNKGIAKRRILYGRRKFEVEVLIGLAIIGTVIVVRALVWNLADIDIMVNTIGFLIPGIIAHDMSRQGPSRTVIAISATTGILGLFLIVYIKLLEVTGATVEPQRVLASVIGYDRRLMLEAIAMGVLMGMYIFEKLGLRSGGFITAAYVAFLLPRWPDLLFLLVVAFLTWLVVVKLLMPRLLLFGRRKLSTMVLFGTLLGWSAELLCRYFSDGLYEPGRGLTIMTMMLPALIANDVQRQGWERTGWGLAINTAGVYGVMNVVGAGLAAVGVFNSLH